MALRLPDFHSVKRTGDNNFGAERDAGIRAQFFIDIHAALRIDRDFHCVGGQCTALLLAHLTRANFVEHFGDIALKSFGSHDVNALVATEGEITAWLETWTECSRQRKTTLGVELALMHSNKHGSLPSQGEVLRLHLCDRLPPLLPTVNHFTPLSTTIPPTDPHRPHQGHSSALGKGLGKFGLRRKGCEDGRNNVGSVSRKSGNGQSRDPLANIRGCQ
ncbi:unannotated protein [freshwater metagenome]|uniref:Unannotated protein n=1 Tax=freshwater metagenome TaxID=449393 RepID=A0A6J6HG61_9ZZZZ